MAPIWALFLDPNPALLAIRRNAGLSAAVLAVAVVLILGLAGTTAMYFRAERLRVEAQASAEREASARAEAERALAQA
ncbi:MAG: hypothetical protein P8X85_20580, partial [Desulfobacterales bacterium]